MLVIFSFVLQMPEQFLFTKHISSPLSSSAHGDQCLSRYAV